MCQNDYHHFWYIADLNLRKTVFLLTIIRSVKHSSAFICYYLQCIYIIVFLFNEKQILLCYIEIRASLIAQRVKNAGDPSSIPWSGRNPGEGIGYWLQYLWGFPGGSDDKESTCNVGDLGSIPGLGRTPEKGMATHWRISQTQGVSSKVTQKYLSSW